MQSENLINSIIANIPSFVFWKDASMIYQGCNNNFAAICGLSSPAEIVGKTDKDLPWSKFFAKVYKKEDLSILKKGMTISNRIVPLITTKGDERLVSVSKVPLYDSLNKKIIGVLGVFTDITDQKKAEEESLKAKEQLNNNNQAKAKFLRILQHDLRNKLTGILSFSDLLLDFLDDKATLKKGLVTINHAGKSIIPTLDRINHYLSLETGQLKPYYSIFELNALLKSFKEKYQPELSVKNLSMKFKLDSKLEGRFVGDSLLIYDILDQLIANAIKFTDKGQISIETYLIRKQRDNTVGVDILIRDSGPGIAPQVANNLFRLFDCDPADEAKKYIMPGINLSISKKIAELLGGDLMVDSQAGKGTDFIFYIKLKTVKAEKKLSLKSPIIAFNLEEEEEKEPSFGKKKFQVLVIEDDSINQEAMQALLSTYFHCDILTAIDLKSAKSLISQNSSIDLILTDIHLPDGEGHEIMPYLYELHSLDDNLPWVVAVTAFAREVDIDYFCEQGIANVISKPITLKELTYVISRLFGKKVIKKIPKSF